MGEKIFKGKEIWDYEFDDYFDEHEIVEFSLNDCEQAAIGYQHGIRIYMVCIDSSVGEEDDTNYLFKIVYVD